MEIVKQVTMPHLHNEWKAQTHQQQQNRTNERKPDVF